MKTIKLGAIMKRSNHVKTTIAPRKHTRIARLTAIAVASMVAIALALSTAFPNAYAQNFGSTPPTRERAKQPSDAKSATVLVYMNGSDLESEAGEATADIQEMLDSNIGSNANVVIETLGTREWQEFGIASDHTQRYLVKQGKLELVDDSLPQLDTTSPDTLSDFISWGVKNYPADRYILVLWDHGAGPVYGFGYDEFQPEESALTLDEMKQALDANADVHFDIIGMDCCIMGSLETCVALKPYCNYMVLSEDFEPGIGWSYANWMSKLEKNPGVDTVELGTTIVDDMISDVAKDEENGDATLALIDESKIDDLYTAWVDFAYANEDSLLNTNYSQETEWRSRPGQEADDKAHNVGDHHSEHDGFASEGGWGGYDELDEWASMWDDWDYDGSYVTMTDYFVTDIMEVASTLESDQATALKEAFNNAMVHFGSTSGEEGMSGLSVTLPYGDAEFYDQLEEVFMACGIDSNYIDWLESFVEAEGADNFYDYGFEDYGFDDYGYGNYELEDYSYDFGGHGFEDYGFNEYGYYAA